MILFLIIISWVIFQRIVELYVAKVNERHVKDLGAIEYGARHYPYMVGMHVLFFVTLISEVIWTGFQTSPVWQPLLLVFLGVQALRLWALMTLGRFWNTKILVLPDGQRVAEGPYRFMKHPNYVVVILEIMLLPLIFQAYVTAAIFSVANFLFLYFIRIPKEEEALRHYQK
ncbi:isoprenylcysteine carboxyl methyltransferase family protein [Geomicrobium sp. JCM 19055]|uniref:isoprenylcysteine carboxyl methyltransferase family protein n=1 Tax=Geomicrobium sp. JCM 19055 TaxID=1460649 RepID=UPI00045ED742|nr:isoprenylcysteine carboxylmethyltransferase family protein [Geomicrobium sp. JCM 19055]GAJ98484.1 alkylpyrone O-methyltransferase [Geomicrobium sp. JCM 19055]